MKTCPKCERTYPDDFTLCPRDGSPLAAQATATEALLAVGLSRRFRIVRRLGAGGMGAVFLAEQVTVGNRPVALKVLSRKLLDDPEFLLRFQNEAGSTGRIRHPNVVTIHESGQADDGTPYIAMEFLEGESLGDALKRRGALPVPEVAEILQQAARGLTAAHKLGIIHRDLKPDNIFLTRDDEGRLVVKVVDFGIAKLRQSSTHTQTGMVLGTPAYMSCEQASGMRSEDLDARSDIYSLGVMVYQMLSGRLPFHSDTPLGYLRKHMLEEPPPFRASTQGLNAGPMVETAVMKALAKNREERYASALDFSRELMSASQPLVLAETLDPLPTTRIVSLTAGESSEPLPSTKVVIPPAERQPVEPAVQALGTHASDVVTVQAPRLTRPASGSQKALRPDRVEIVDEGSHPGWKPSAPRSGEEGRFRPPAIGPVLERKPEDSNLVRNLSGIAAVGLLGVVLFFGFQTRQKTSGSATTTVGDGAQDSSAPKPAQPISQMPGPAVPPNPSEPSTSTLRIGCDVECSWTFDGTPEGVVQSGQIVDFTAPSGAHIVVARDLANGSNGQSKREYFVLDPGKLLPISFQLQTKGPAIESSNRNEVDELMAKADALRNNGGDNPGAYAIYQHVSQLDPKHTMAPEAPEKMKEIRNECASTCPGVPAPDP